MADEIITISNKMEVASKIVAPPQKIIRYEAIKDTYISQLYPVNSYGDFKNLEVNSTIGDEEDENKILMTFSLPEITQDIYDNIVQVRLRLYSQGKITRKANLKLKAHYDNGWIENGVTYIGQPYEYPEVIQTTTVNKGDTYVDFDLTDIYKSHNKEAFDLAYNIVEDETDGQQYYLNFFSKEAAKENTNLKLKTPAIELVYEYYPDNMDISDLPAVLTSKVNVVDGTDPTGASTSPDLPVTLEIHSKWTDADLESEVGVTTYTDYKDLEAELTVQRWGYAFGVDGEVTVKRTIPNDDDVTPELDSEVIVPEYHVDDGDNPDDIVYIIHKQSPYIEAEVGVKTYYVPSDTEPAPDLDCQFDIRVSVPNTNEPAPDLESLFATHEFIADGTENNPDENYWVTHVEPVDLECVFDTRHFVPNDTEPAPDLDAELNIAFHIADDGDNPDPDYPWYVHDPSATLDSQFIIRRNVPDETEPAPDVEASFAVHEFIADGSDKNPDANEWITHVDPKDMECQFYGMYGGKNDLECEFAVACFIADDGDNPDTEHPWVTHVPSSNLACTFVCKQNVNEDLESEIEVKTYYVPNDTEPAPDLESEFIIPDYKVDDGTNNLDTPWIIHKKAPYIPAVFVASIHVPNDTEPAPDLESEFIFRAVDVNDLPCEFIITDKADMDATFTGRCTRVSDLLCIFSVSRGLNLPYSYIM